MTVSTVILTEDQETALSQITAAVNPGERYLLTGHAGSGKTTMMQHFARAMLERGKSIVLTAPTHKAVSVLARKLAEAEIAVDCRTIHSLLSLKPRPHGDRLVFERDRHAEPVTSDIVVVDECSMVDEQLFRQIRRHLPLAFVLFIGDPAQLPPVGEVDSLTFGIKGHSHLSTIVRQAAGNPILHAANTIRESQGKNADWSWCVKSALNTGMGVFKPKTSEIYKWMEKAFTSAAFEEDPDAFRYLAWTNRRVEEINNLVRRWRYGTHIPTPFMVGERAMFRAPLIIANNLLFMTNEEATVIAIERSQFERSISSEPGVAGWIASLSSWAVTLRSRGGTEYTVHMPADDRAFNQVIARFKDEAANASIRWKQMHEFQSSVARLQAIYSLTVHTSQGSTFGSTFADISDMRKRQSTNLLEMQKLLYTAATRPSQRLILVNI